MLERGSWLNFCSIGSLDGCCITEVEEGPFPSPTPSWSVRGWRLPALLARLIDGWAVMGIPAPGPTAKVTSLPSPSIRNSSTPVHVHVRLCQARPNPQDGVAPGIFKAKGDSALSMLLPSPASRNESSRLELLCSFHQGLI